MSHPRGSSGPSASGAEMLKKDAAKSSAPSINAAWRGYILPGLGRPQEIHGQQKKGSKWTSHAIQIHSYSNVLFHVASIPCKTWSEGQSQHDQYLLQIRPKRIRIRIVVLIQFPTSEWDLQQLQQDQNDQRESQCHGWRNKWRHHQIHLNQCVLMCSGPCTALSNSIGQAHLNNTICAQCQQCPELCRTVRSTLQQDQSESLVNSKLSNFWHPKTQKPRNPETIRNP